MAAKKKAAPKVEEVDTSKSTGPVVHENNDPIEAPAAPEERSSAYSSEHFVVRFDKGKVLIAPLNWVGPAPLQIPETRLDELRELLNQTK